MRAIQFRTTGGPEVLDLVELPTPRPGNDEVLISICAAGVGKPDVLMRTGVYRWMPPLPATPGAEISGTIEALGSGVDPGRLRVGQRVLGYHFKGRGYAEYAAIPASDVTPLADGIDFDDAVSIPNYQVAYALLHVAARGADKQVVYVNGAAGGIGCAVIQLCRLEGLTVIAGASSDEKCAFARAQGAQHTINYSRENIADRVLEITDGHGANLVLDHIIGKLFTDSLRMLASMGLIVSFNALGGFPEKDLFREMRANLPKSPGVRCFTMHHFDHDPDGRQQLAEQVMALFAGQKVRPPIHDRLPLAEAQRAHRLLDDRAVMGKLVLNP
ncbi:MAG: zinc-binding alcohol dehydrogenase family protein [Burkholderiales bacterium]